MNRSFIANKRANDIRATKDCALKKRLPSPYLSSLSTLPPYLYSLPPFPPLLLIHRKSSQYPPPLGAMLFTCRRGRGHGAGTNKQKSRPCFEGRHTWATRGFEGGAEFIDGNGRRVLPKKSKTDFFYTTESVIPTKYRACNRLIRMVVLFATQVEK